MKFSLLLFLAMTACTKPIYKVGDCISFHASPPEWDLQVEEILKKDYLFKYVNRPDNGTRVAYPIKSVDSNSILVKCGK